MTHSYDPFATPDDPQPETVRCDWCGEAGEAELVDGDKRACADCLDRCNECGGPVDTFVPIEKVRCADPIAVGGECAICFRCFEDVPADSTPEIEPGDSANWDTSEVSF